MNNNLIKANQWLTDLGIATQTRNSGSLFVSRHDTEAIGSMVELLTALKDTLGTTKLFWNQDEATMGWLVLESF